MASKKNNNNMSNFFDNENTGMLSSLEPMNVQEKVAFIKKFINMMIVPTTNIASAISNEKLSSSQIGSIMTIFASVHIDCDLHNLTILEDNINTKLLQSLYDKTGYYMCDSCPVIDKRTKEVCILMSFYKKVDTSPLDFVDQISKGDNNVLGYIYLRELISLAQKNYRNKFTLANRARLYLYQQNPNMEKELLDKTAVALAKMAMDFHINSMMIDNFRQHDDLKLDVDALKKNPTILYSEKYKYTMTHLEILEDLLQDAIIEYYNSNSQTNQQQNQQTNGNENQNGNESDDADNQSNQDSEQNQNTSTSDDQNAQAQAGTSDEDGNTQSNTGQSGDTSGTNQSQGLDRSSPFDRNMSGQFLRITFKSNKNSVFFMNMPPRDDNDRYDRLDNQGEHMIDQYQDYIDYATSKIKGTGMNKIMANIGMPIEIDMQWEEKIIRYVDDMTNLSSSHKSMKTWARINNYTRHITTLPGRKEIPESNPTIYLMFDQSGSMGNHIIRKINYVIEYFYKKKYKINVFVHDWAESAEDVDVYEFKLSAGNMDINGYTTLDQLVSSRIRSGGTSHKGVFDIMQQYFEEIKSGSKKYNSHYVLIASDLYSDIEEIYKKYEWVNILGKNVMALTDSKDKKLPFGQTILIEQSWYVCG